MDGPAPDTLLDSSAWTAGSTWAVVVLALPSDVLGPRREWAAGPLPVLFGPDGHAATAERRGTYHASDLTALVHGQTHLANRYHRAVLAEEPQDAPDGLRVQTVGLERLHVDLGSGIRTDVLLVHVVVHRDGGLASRDDADLRALARLLQPSRHLGAVGPVGLAGLLGVEPEVLGRALDDAPSPWFTLLRSANADVTLVRRGAATGAPPGLAALSAEQAEERQSLRISLSGSWEMEVGARGYGYVLYDEDRATSPDFHRRDAPAYVRSLYVDEVLLVMVQEQLLRALRSALREAASSQAVAAAHARVLDAGMELQRAIALYRTHVWATHVGRAGERERAFARLQQQRDLTQRLADLGTASDSVRDVLLTAVARRDDEHQARSRQTGLALSAALGAVTALAVPQTVLAALQLADPQPDVRLRGVLGAAGATAWLSIGMAAVVLLALVLVLTYAATTYLRPARRR